jgi:hypothetical protein
MKPLLSSRARLSCRVVRWRAGVLGGVPAPQHLEACADCRRYFAACDELDMALRGDAMKIEAQPPTGLDRAILVTLGTAVVDRRPKRVPSVLVVAAAAFVMGALIAIGFRTGWWHGLVEPARGASPDVIALADAAEVWSDRVWNSTLPAAGEFVQDNALQQEVDAVYADARSAVDFLALNFLPTAENGAPKGGRPAKG